MRQQVKVKARKLQNMQDELDYKRQQLEKEYSKLGR